MDKYKIRNKWTAENIHYLKTAYLRGLPLKQIAVQLNRSVSGINKVLDRYHLRTRSTLQRLPSLPSPTARPLQPKRKLGAQTRKKNIQKIKFPCEDARRWVLFECVLYWLRSQRIPVMKSDSDVYYEVNGFPKNEQQILLIANLLREQHQLPIFFVEGVTNA
jgi:hypothetical protein